MDAGQRYGVVNKQKQNETKGYQVQPRTFDVIYDSILNLINPSTTILPPTGCGFYPCGPYIPPRPSIQPSYPSYPFYPYPQCCGIRPLNYPNYPNYPGQIPPYPNYPGQYPQYPYRPGIINGIRNSYYPSLLTSLYGQGVNAVQNTGSTIYGQGVNTLQNTGSNLYGQGVNAVQNTGSFLFGYYKVANESGNILNSEEVYVSEKPVPPKKKLRRS